MKIIASIILVLLFIFTGCYSDNDYYKEYETVLDDDEEQANYHDRSPYAIDLDSTPDSSCFMNIGYDPIYEQLVVQFRDSGDRYVYYNVGISEWNEFSSANSLGEYYNQYIKYNYDYDCMD